MSELDNVLVEIRELLKNNQFEAAFQSLEEHGYKDAATQFASRFDRLIHNERMGTISREDAEVARARLIEDIIKFLEKPGPDPPEFPFARLLRIFLIILGLAGGLWLCFGLIASGSRLVGLSNGFGRILAKSAAIFSRWI
jgi:hypothetical protein